jgi:glycosyltransferase involved in cell wall biosynthesis
MVRSKRPAVALHTLRALLATHPEASLTFLGDGPELKRIKQLTGTLGIDQHVQFLGWTRVADMPGYYRMSDVLLFTSIRDSGCIAAIEAAAQGTPTVGLPIQGFGASYKVTEACFVKHSDVASDRRSGEAFARAVALVVDRDAYQSVSKRCLEFAHSAVWHQRAYRIVSARMAPDGQYLAPHNEH